MSLMSDFLFLDQTVLPCFHVELEMFYDIFHGDNLGKIMAYDIFNRDNLGSNMVYDKMDRDLNLKSECDNIKKEGVRQQK